MTFTQNGLIQSFLDFLGIQITTSDGYYITYITVSILAISVLLIIMTFLFKFLVYLRKG